MPLVCPRVGRVRAAIEVPGPVSEAEALWYDVTRWPNFVDGFGAVAKREGDWPQTGGVLVWDSRPGGRGRVLERVRSFEPRIGQRAAVEDERLVGTQTVAFAAAGDAVRVELALEYELKRRAALLGAAADLVLVRRALRGSLARTLYRFSRELAGDRELGLR